MTGNSDILKVFLVLLWTLEYVELYLHSMYVLMGGSDVQLTFHFCYTVSYVLGRVDIVELNTRTQKL